jgi:hypothetical protein
MVKYRFVARLVSPRGPSHLAAETRGIPLVKSVPAVPPGAVSDIRGLKP